MPIPEDLDSFEAAVRTAVAAVLPSGAVETVARTIIVIKLRVDLHDGRFIDVFFNSRNRRADLSLIDGGTRIFGYDNLGGWHCHRPEAPERHDPCAEPAVEDFSRTAVALGRRA